MRGMLATCWAEDRIPLAWGPVRHGIGHNVAIRGTDKAE
jgi:hypothetical protein